MPASDELASLVVKRGQLKARLTRFKAFFENIGPDRNMELKLRLQKFEPCWSEFDSVQSNIELLDSSESQFNERDAFENNYFELLANIHNFLEPPTSSTQNESGSGPVALTNASSRVKLPTIQLPTFDGSYDKWLTFHDTFRSLIDNDETLSNIQKFHYLRSSLRGDAHNVIESLEITSDNYEIAWNLLVQRFQNKRVIIQRYVKSLFEMNAVQNESPTALRTLSDELQKNIRALNALGLNTDQWDAIVIHLVNTKLDPVTTREWETRLQSTPHDQLPTVQMLTGFLASRCQMLEAIEHGRHGSIKENTSCHVTTQVSCPFCAQTHALYQCKKFLALGIPQRQIQVSKHKLCRNCLKQGHYANQCQGGTCKKCHSKHNTLLHVESNSSAVGPSNQDKVVTNTTPTAASPDACNHATFLSRNTILATAQIHIFSNRNCNEQCRALLDSGSQVSFITEACVQRLGLRRSPVDRSITGIGLSQSQIKYAANVRISSRLTEYSAHVQCLVLHKITQYLPALKLDREGLDLPSGKLADPRFNIPDKIDILLGSDIFWEVLCSKHKKISNTLTAWNTQFGWVITGTSNHTSNHTSHLCISSSSFDSLNQQLAQFWELENNANESPWTLQEQKCEQHFMDNYCRDPSGRFIVKLPFNGSHDQLGESRSIALRRFLNLEKRLESNPKLKQEYVKFMDEYLSLRHMELIDEGDNLATPHSYLPHHGVLKQSNNTAKLRVVFDGSAPTSTGKSLNSLLMVGPTIQQDLFSIICRFRKHQFVFTADIVKMYRQIKVDSDSANFQRILWRSDPSLPIRDYRLTTVTYGTSSAPFLAIRSLQQLAKEHKNEYQIASEIVLNDFYVDDVITGSDSISHTQIMCKQLISLLSKAGFQLDKWNTNLPDILKAVTDKQIQPAQVNFDSSESVKTLGLWWNPRADTLQFTVSVTDVKTKRGVISNIARVFDPLGLIGPVIVTMKMFLQELWKLNLEWDDPLPENVQREWEVHQGHLDTLSQLTIPRLIIREQNSRMQLRGYCDASERAYGACIYIITADSNHGQLVCSKSRVAPVKRTTLPRLELCGALLLANLMSKTNASLNLQFHEVAYCTDSMIVLSWLASEASKWKSFVATRVARIQDLTRNGTWHHVTSKNNPADLISRGVTPQALIHNRLWWNGPSDHGTNELNEPLYTNEPESLVEAKSVSLTAQCTISKISIFERFSSFTKLQRVTAYCFRFYHNSKLTPNVRVSGHLKATELNCALTGLIKAAQSESFECEINDLRHHGRVQNKSNILNLNPFLDPDGVLRVGGRLSRSHIRYDQKHQIILPSAHQFTKLLLTYYHIVQLHAGPMTVLATVRSRYWPVNAKVTLKSIVRKCITCIKAKPILLTQLMGDLPPHRVEPARPFKNVGVDYCGPIQILMNNSRRKIPIKAYIAIFVCLATKAVHIELVGDLTTKSFINTLKRFISRRGQCANIYSDNATNFAGANKEIAKMLQLVKGQMRNEQVASYLANTAITWHFIPPRSPNFGGLWEAAVKSCKTHLKKVVGNALLTYEEMHTILCQVEACLNSRPLTPLSNDPDDLTVLTPGHFLIGEPPTAIIEPDLSDLRCNRLSRWQRTQQLFQHFWKRWSLEYLNQLQHRVKWQKASPNLQVGEMVLLRDDNSIPINWTLGRIIDQYPGPDNRVRVVQVKTATGIFKRPINKICPLPLEDPPPIVESSSFQGGRDVDDSK